MVYLTPDLLRPATLTDIRAPAIVQQIGRYGASFLIVGERDHEAVIFLSGEFEFRTFPRAQAGNWHGLGIEGIEFEVDAAEAIDVTALGRSPGMMIRRDDVLAIVAIADETFRRTVEVPVQTSLGTSTGGHAVGFPKWRAIITIAEERRIVWESNVVVADAS